MHNFITRKGKNKRMNTQLLLEEDLRHIWHPCTQMKDHETLPLVPIKRGKGVYLFDFDDNAYLDGVSSWWVVWILMCCLDIDVLFGY